MCSIILQRRRRLGHAFLGRGELNGEGGETLCADKGKEGGVDAGCREGARNKDDCRLASGGRHLVLKVEVVWIAKIRTAWYLVLSGGWAVVLQ